MLCSRYREKQLEVKAAESLVISKKLPAKQILARLCWLVSHWSKHIKTKPFIFIRIQSRPKSPNYRLITVENFLHCEMEEN